MTRIFKGQGYTLEYVGHEQYLDKIGWKTAGSAGFDVCFFDEPGRVQHLGCYSFPTGIKILDCSPELVGLLFLRSSAAGRGLRMANPAAVIDSDYRNEIRILLDRYPTTFGLPIAQLVFVPFAGPLVAPEAQRTGGFGSTDK